MAKLEAVGTSFSSTITIDGHSAESLLSDKARLDWLEEQFVLINERVKHDPEFRTLFNLRTKIDLERFAR